MNPTTNAPSGLVSGFAKKEKYWAELTDSEKIERMREIIKQNDYRLNKIYQLENKISKLRTLLISHSHSELGVVSKIEQYDNLDSPNCVTGGGIASSLPPTEVYF